MNIFSYESKFSQVLMFVADLAILNLVFVLCCIPIFTIGAAQAALYSGIRTLQDPEDGESPVKAFFRAFKIGFGSVTGAWFVFSVLEFLMASIIYGMLLVPGFPVWTAILGKCRRDCPTCAALHLSGRSKVTDLDRYAQDYLPCAEHCALYMVCVR